MTSNPDKNVPSNKPWLLCLVLLFASFSSNAQVVNDGATRTLANVTNTFTGNVIVGTNGSFTLLVISNNALLTNAIFGDIGHAATAKSNEVRLVSDTSRWLMGSHLFVGTDGSFNRLVVSNGAKVFNNVGVLSGNSSASNNLVLVTGAGSTWSNRSGLNVGNSGTGNNRLIVEAGGQVFNVGSLLGGSVVGSNNAAIVTGNGSFWKNLGDLSAGFNGSYKTLVVSDGAVVRDTFGSIGAGTSASNNTVLVTGPGSEWHTTFNMSIGGSSSGNQLVVSNGGAMFVGNGFSIGSSSSSTNNRVVIEGGTLRSTNSLGNSGYDIRRGTNVFNGGVIEADRLLLTNDQGFFEFNAGTLTARNSRVSNGTLFRIGNGVSPATFRLAGNGLHEFTGILAAIVSSNATFTGNGTVVGPVLQFAGGSRLAPGSSIGGMIFSNSPTLHGTVIMEISKSGVTLTNDQIQVTAALLYGGSLIVSNVGPDALSVGDRFHLFGAPGYSGSFSNVTLPPLDPPLVWRDDLSVNGSITIIGPSVPGFSAISRSGTNLILSGTNGPLNGSYTVLTATNVALPLSNWVSIATNQFDPFGGFSFTNAIIPEIPQQFFQLEVR